MHRGLRWSAHGAWQSPPWRRQSHALSSVPRVHLRLSFRLSVWLRCLQLFGHPADASLSLLSLSSLDPLASTLVLPTADGCSGPQSLGDKFPDKLKTYPAKRTQEIMKSVLLVHRVRKKPCPMSSAVLCTVLDLCAFPAPGFECPARPSWICSCNVAVGPPCPWRSLWKKRTE